MKIELTTKTLVTVIGAFIMLVSVKISAFTPPQPAVEQCMAAVTQKYAILPQDLERQKTRARPTGKAAAVVYLHIALQSDPEQRRVKMHCTVDQHGSVTRLRANPRFLDVAK